MVQFLHVTFIFQLLEDDDGYMEFDLDVDEAGDGPAEAADPDLAAATNLLALSQPSQPIELLVDQNTYEELSVNATVSEDTLSYVYDVVETT